MDLPIGPTLANASSCFYEKKWPGQCQADLGQFIKDDM